MRNPNEHNIIQYNTMTEIVQSPHNYCQKLSLSSNMTINNVHIKP